MNADIVILTLPSDMENLYILFTIGVNELNKIGDGNFSGLEAFSNCTGENEASRFRYMKNIDIQYPQCYDIVPCRYFKLYTIDIYFC